MDDMRPSGGARAAAMGLASLFPPGLQAIYGECRRLYPEQPNPLQVTAIVKYWLGGPDPLDYISMYRCVGSPAQHVPEHWHYVSFGLSDLYGDNRVHEFTGQDGPSGFGFELTFRLKREAGETAPPTWPAELMQGLARYVFQSENTFCSGDHVSWHSPLDNSESRIQHMLLTEDPQLQPVQTPFGLLTFLQQERVDKGIETDGSNLSGVSAKCAWEDLSRPPDDEDDSRSICVGSQPRRLSDKAEVAAQEAVCSLQCWSRKDSLESESSAAIVPHELVRTRQLESVHLQFNQESGTLIPLCLKGRLLHGRHFTYKSITGDTAITFVSTGVEGAFATEEHPYAAHGPWLQPKLPKEYSWPEKKLKISILPDSVFDSPLQ
ncbi:Suppressor of fused-like [Acipenser ruthenus]|uniref:Suppressor of fused-like n=1 Tax=Acipenser ruthenus TaxID=7906 RepID=A0A662YSE2_ACIRT|nr:Suppressor of fused-like [Acipenser ruthenus]